MENNSVCVFNPEIVKYYQDPNKKGNFILDKDIDFNVRWFKINRPRKETIKKRGATYVIDTFINNQYTFLTSLVQIKGLKNFFLGDIDSKTLIVWINPSFDSIVFAYFKDHTGPTLMNRLQFATNYIKVLYKQKKEL